MHSETTGSGVQYVTMVSVTDRNLLVVPSSHVVSWHLLVRLAMRLERRVCPQAAECQCQASDGCEKSADTYVIQDVCRLGERGKVGRELYVLVLCVELISEPLVFTCRQRCHQSGKSPEGCMVLLRRP